MHLCKWPTQKASVSLQSSLTEELQLWLLSTLYKSAVLPEKLWGSMSTGQQDVLLQRRGAMAEPLLEAVGEHILVELLASVHLCVVPIW